MYSTNRNSGVIHIYNGKSVTKVFYDSQNNIHTCIQIHMSRPMGKPTICIGENKGADQLRGNREAGQRLYFRLPDCTIPLLLYSEISSF